MGGAQWSGHGSSLCNGGGGGEGGMTIIEGTGISLAHQLPGKPAEGTRLFDELS